MNVTHATGVGLAIVHGKGIGMGWVFTIETITSSNIVHFADGSRNKEMHETPMELIFF